MIVDFSKYSSIKIGPKKDIFVINKIINIDDFVVGKCNNLLINPNTKINLAILGEEFNYIKYYQDLLIIGAKTTSSEIVRFCRKNNISNLEFLSKIPGSLGGIVKMNAGVGGFEIFDFIEYININGKIYSKNDIKYSYRYTNINGIIYEVGLNIKKGFKKDILKKFIHIKKNQPKGYSCGSCFKNPKGFFAGKLIEEVGLKGFKKGGCMFSPLHANFLINFNNGTFEDAIYLINLAKEKVYNQFNIKLEEEIKIIF